MAVEPKTKKENNI